MRVFSTLHLVKSEDLNIHGTLFAARASQWIVEASYIAAAATYGNPSEVVCRSTNNIEFRRPVGSGDIIRIDSRVVGYGNSSIFVAVEVVSELTGEVSVQGLIIFVTVQKDGKATLAHGLKLDEAADDKEREQRKMYDAWVTYRKK